MTSSSPESAAPQDVTPLDSEIGGAGSRRSWLRADTLALAAAILMVLGLYLPAFTLQVLNADSLGPIVYLRDVLELGRPAAGFLWGGKSDLFPDVLVLFASYFVSGNGLQALQAVTSFIFAGFLASAVVLYRQSGGARPLSFAGLSLVVLLGMTRHFGLPGGSLAHTFFAGMHGGSAVMTFLCLALLQQCVVKGRAGSRPLLLGLLCFLGGASDPLFLAGFIAPAGVTMVALSLRDPRRFEWAPETLFAIVASGILGFRATRAVAPVQLVDYSALSKDGLSRGFSTLLELANPQAGSYLIVLLLLNAAFLFIGFTVLIRGSAAPSPPKSRPVTFLLVFIAFMVSSSWAAAFLTGHFSELGSTRYLLPALLTPLFAALGALHDRVITSEARARFFTAACVVIAVDQSLLSRPAPGSFLTGARELASFLAPVMRQEGIEAGLSDYWWAHPITYLSNEKVPMRAITQDGVMLHWTNNREVFTGEIARRAPRFRLILMERLDARLIRERFGRPDRILNSPSGHAVWLYSKEHAIVYHPEHDHLGNDVTDGSSGRISLPASALPSTTGTKTGDAVVAVAGRDEPGYLVYGPYKELTAGEYQISLEYQLSGAPRQGPGLLYEAVLWNGSAAKVLDHAEMAGTSAKPRAFVRRIVFPDAPGATLEVRVYYQGVGTAEVHWLDVSKAPYLPEAP